MLRSKRGRDSERPAHRDEEWPPLAATRESPRTETKKKDWGHDPCFFFFWGGARHCTWTFPHQGSSPRPRQWKLTVVTTGPLRSSSRTNRFSLRSPGKPPPHPRRMEPREVPRVSQSVSDDKSPHQAPPEHPRVWASLITTEPQLHWTAVPRAATPALGLEWEGAVSSCPLSSWPGLKLPFLTHPGLARGGGVCLLRLL